ncbi:MAG: MFS transporter [Pseudomonadota bacterium]
MNAIVDKLPTGLKIYWGSGALGVAILMNAVAFLILAYFVGVLKIDPALAGTLVFVSKIIDAISDPIVGIISDKSKFAMGRRRPFLFVGSFLSAIAFALLFTVPQFDSETTTAIYAFTCLVLYTLGYTIFNVPYMAMSAEMTDGYEERTALHGWRVAFVSIGSSIAGAGAPLILQEYGSTQTSYSIIAAVFAALIFASMMTCFFGTRSARTVQQTTSVHNFYSQVGSLLANRHFLTLISVKALQLIGVMSTVSVMLFYLQKYVGLDLRYLTAFGLLNTLVTFLAIPVLKQIAERIGKRNTYYLSATATLLYNLSWALVEPNPPMNEFLPGYFVRAVVSGFVIAGNVMLAMSMLTDTIEYDARRTGLRREGIYASMYSFVEKISGALGPFLVGWILALTGYDKTLPEEARQSDEALFGLVFGMAYLPAIMIGLSMLVLLFYRLDKKTLADTGPAPA